MHVPTSVKSPSADEIKEKHHICRDFRLLQADLFVVAVVVVVLFVDMYSFFVCSGSGCFNLDYFIGIRYLLESCSHCIIIII